MALGACNNLGLMDQLETPGQAGSTNNISPDIFLFATTNSFNGNIRGGMADPRTAADIQCQNTRTTLTFPNNACSKVRAVISLSSADSIANIPLNYGLPLNRNIHAPNNFVLASDWPVLVAGTASHNLGGNGVMGAGMKWWSFSTSGGNYNGTDNCTGGTEGASGQGPVGDSSTTGGTWLNSSMNLCSTPAQLLCVCF